MFSRKECRKRARQHLKHHYALFAFICLVAAMIGTKYESSLNLLTESYKEQPVEEQTEDLVESGKTEVSIDVRDLVHQIIRDNVKEWMGENNKPQEKPENIKIGKHLEIGYSAGVFSMIHNALSSGTFLVGLTAAYTAAFGHGGVAVAAGLLVGALAVIAFWVFFVNMFQIIMARIFLEGRIYEEISIGKITFLVRVRKWCRASLTMAGAVLLFNLWTLTIVGGFIKYFSYFAVPYILAENPSLNTKQTVCLSKKMMKGHKWECFVLKLSFLPYDILNIVTLGIFGLLYLNAYKEAAMSEYYTYVRACAKDHLIEDVELLNDEYLYQKAEEGLLERTYEDMVPKICEEEIKNRKEKEEDQMLSGKTGFLERNFGVIWVENEEKHQRRMELEMREHYESVRLALAGKSYPRRLYPMAEAKWQYPRIPLYPNRRYSVLTLVFIFMVMSFGGWMWEVFLHLAAEGRFVNRGVLHGPWLPIYGTGAIIILTLLYRFRKKPVAEFFMAVLVCGVTEYFTGWLLETINDGKKWWDYSGYFFNIDGRVCAEGLLVFGLGGMAAVYLVAPILDNWFSSWNQKIRVAVVMTFICLFIADIGYSQIYPNTGDGITYEQEETENIQDLELLVSGKRNNGSIISCADLHSGKWLHYMAADQMGQKLP